MEKVDSNAVLINLDQLNAFNRVDYVFFRLFCPRLDSEWTFAAGFAFCMYTLKPWWRWMGNRSIRKGCLLSPMLYVLVLEFFFRNLRVSLILSRHILPSPTISARYSSYADDVSVLVTSSAKVEKFRKEIGKYVSVSRAKINREKSMGLRFGSWKSCALSDPFSLTNGLCKILGVWFGPVSSRRKIGRR